MFRNGETKYRGDAQVQVQAYAEAVGPRGKRFEVRVKSARAIFCYISVSLVLEVLEYPNF